MQKEFIVQCSAYPTARCAVMVSTLQTTSSSDVPKLKDCNRLGLGLGLGPEHRQTKPSLRGTVTGFTGDNASHFIINGGTKFFLTEPRTQPRDGNSALVTIGTTGSATIIS